MLEVVARAVLRILGIVTVLVGTILTVQAVLTWVAFNATLASATMGMQIKAPNALGFWGIVSQAVPILFGAVLFRLSPSLARRVVS